MVGLSKTVLTVLSGILTFRTPVTPQNLAGLLLATCALGWYSFLQVTESPAGGHSAPPAGPLVEEEKENVGLISTEGPGPENTLTVRPSGLKNDLYKQYKQ